MSDGQQPLFLGGLPPRSSTPAGEPPKSKPLSAKSFVSKPKRKPWNTLAVIAMIVSFFISFAGIVIGFLALRQLRERDERGRGLALAGMLIGGIGFAVTVALFALFLLGGPTLVSSMTGLGAKAGPSSTAFPTANPVSKQEAKEAKAAIAGGGGAIPGHIVSGEFCKALSSFQTVSAGKSTITSVSPEVLTAMQMLATVKSPNRIAYEHMAAMAAEPSSVPSIVKAQAIAADFAKAVQVDVTTCA